MTTRKTTWAALAVLALAGSALVPDRAGSMCCYFRPIIVDINQTPAEILQPSQVAFITWDGQKQIETVTVQPRFEGNARDFAMVIPTPSQPKLDDMPRDFFKALGTFTTPKRREFPQSRLMPMPVALEMAQRAAPAGGPGGGAGPANQPRPTTVKVLEVGLVGSLEYKIITAGRPDDLFTWLKDNKYHYAGDEATLDHYVKQKYCFTVMKIDTLQMKKNADGSYTGDITPTRFTFKSEKLVYPLKITQISIKDKTEAQFYVLSNAKMDLPGDQSYQFNWLSMLRFVESTMGPQDLTESNRKYLGSLKGKDQDILKRAQELGFSFQLEFNEGFAPRPIRPIRPLPILKGKADAVRTPTTLEWAKKLTDQDIQVVAGTRAFTETVPDPDDGFTRADLRDPRMVQAIFKVIQQRLAKFQKDRPRGYLVRKAAPDDLKTLPLLKGHLQPGMYLTKFRHTFNKSEMNDDLVLVQAKVAGIADTSEHEELLRTQVWGGGRRFPLGLPPGGGPLGRPLPLEAAPAPPPQR